MGVTWIRAGGVVATVVMAASSAVAGPASVAEPTSVAGPASVAEPASVGAPMSVGEGGAVEVVIEFGRRVPMRDGVELAADIYRPREEGRYPVVLLRTPYNKANVGLAQGRLFASRGYVYVAMDVRGRGDSDGEFLPYRNDGRDGYDAIEWAAVQPWSNGRVGTIGKSYDAGVQWLAALEQPPHLVAMASLATVGDPGADIFISGPTGLPTPTMLSWYHLVSGRAMQNLGAVDWSALVWHLPVATMDEAAGRPSAYWKALAEHPGGHAWWDPVRYQTRLDEVRVPVLHVTGWYDDVQGLTLRNFAGMTGSSAAPEVRASQKLVVGPWSHALNRSRALGDVDFGPTAVVDLDGYLVRWFDHWLKGEANGIMEEPAARLFVMGENAWTEEHEWPIARTRWTRYYLRSGGRANSLYGDGALSTTPPDSEPPDRFTYDPAKPVPFITPADFAQIGGPDDYRPVQRRDDVLVYTGEPLDAPLTVCGPVRVELHAASSAPDTDFTAKLLDVWPDGYAQRLTDGLVRARYRGGLDRSVPIEPGRAYAYEIDLWNTCQTFERGHRIQVEISSSAFPKYDRNLNTGEPPGHGTRMQRAEQTVYHDRDRPSAIILPIVPPARTAAAAEGRVW